MNEIKHNLYAVQDGAVGTFLPPFTCENDAVACRAFSNAANSETHEFALFSSDYTLFRIGTYCPATGSVEETDHINLGNAKAHVRMKEIAENVDTIQAGGTK